LLDFGFDVPVDRYLDAFERWILGWDGGTERNGEWRSVGPCGHKNDIWFLISFTTFIT